jgi:hypothetical protein
MKYAYKILVVKLRVRDHFGDLHVDGEIMIKWDLRA